MVKKTNILSEPKPTTITLADGKEYIIPPLTLNTLIGLEEELNCSIDKVSELLSNRAASTVRAFLFALLKENHPKLTLKDVGALVTADHLPAVLETVVSTVKSIKV